VPVLPAPPAPTHALGGTRFTALASPSRGTSDVSVWQVEVAPGSPGTGHQLTREEVFVVLSGTAAVTIGGDELTAAAGDVIVVPPFTDFSLSAVGDVPARALVVLPAGGQAILPGGEPFTPPWAE
jgi:mannose-6-phosphate isomerase-like protein (cupin superfamily)